MQTDLAPTDGSRALFATIKAVLRTRGLTYRDVGVAVGLSVSGVKKMFASGDAPWSRVLELAALVDIPVAELIQLSERPAFDEVALSEAQQRGLLEQPSALAVLWKLTVERWSVGRIRAELGLPDQTLRKALTLLDRLDLVHVEADDRVRLPHGDLVRWLNEGPLLEHLHRTWGADALDRALSGDSGALLRLHYLPMNTELRDSFFAELRALIDATLRRARYDQLAAPDAVEAHSLLLACAPGDFVRREGNAGAR